MCSSTFVDSGVGRNVTFPNSLSSSDNIPGFSVYNFTLTTGNGCVVVKSPCVSHLKSIKTNQIFRLEKQ